MAVYITRTAPIETLTDDDRAYLCSEDVGSPVVVKALRILDTQAEALDYLMGPALDKAKADYAELQKTVADLKDTRTTYRGLTLVLLTCLVILAGCVAHLTF